MKCWVFAKTGMAQQMLGTTGVEKSLDSRLVRINGKHLKNVCGRKFESWSHLGGNHSWDGHPPHLMTPDGSPILRSKSISVGYMNYGTSPFLMVKSTINCHFQSLFVCLPEGNRQKNHRFSIDFIVNLRISTKVHEACGMHGFWPQLLGDILSSDFQEFAKDNGPVTDDLGGS